MVLQSLINFEVLEGFSPFHELQLFLLKFIIVNRVLLRENIHEFLGVEISDKLIEFFSTFKIGCAAD